MSKNEVYQLLAARFCHDLASPINAAGLLLEAGQGNETQFLAQQNHANLVSILRFYRLMFTYRSNEDILGRTIEAIREACCSKGVESDIWIADQDSPKNCIPSNLLKALVVVFYTLISHLSEDDRIRLVSDEEDRERSMPEVLLNTEEARMKDESFWIPKDFQKVGNKIRLQKRLELNVETRSPLPDFLSVWSVSIERTDPSSQEALPFFLESLLTGLDTFGALQWRNNGLQTSFVFYEAQCA